MKFRVKTLVPLVWLAAVIAFCACSSDDEESAAVDTSQASVDGVQPSDTTTPDAAQPDAAVKPDAGGLIDVSCGDPSFVLVSGLRRYPYLQTVTGENARVVWTTTIKATGAVEWSTGDDWTRVEASRELYDTDRTLDEVDYWSYEVRLGGLKPGQTYCYRIIQDDVVIGEGLHFTTAWEDPERPLRILAFGDSGTGSVDQLALADWLNEHEFDVFLHLGDMAYGSGTFTEFERFMFEVYRDIMHKTPMWPTMGNHEFKTGAGQPYLDVFSLPEVSPRQEEQERYYSFDYGNVHLVSVDSNDSQIVLAALYSLSGEPNMFDWLRADLAASDKPWKIVFFHHPPYSSSERDPNYLVIDNLLPILEEGGVDLVLSGHDHHTERTKPIWEGNVAPDDPRSLTYIVAGAGGAGLREATGDWWTDMVNDKSHAFVSIEINGCDLTGKAISSEGETIDTFALNGCEEK